jgi:hypothetical protein
MQDFKHLRDPYHMQHRDTAARHYDGVITDPQVRRYRRAALAITLVLCFHLVLIAAAWFSANREESPPPPEYCEMTQLYVTSNGEFGWPDFNKNAHLCTSTTE